MKSQLFPVLGILTLLVLFSCEKGKTTDPEAGKTVSSVTYTSATSDYKNELSFEYDTQGRIVKIILGLPSQTVTTSVEYDNGKVTERTVSSMDDSDFYTESIYTMDNNGRAVSCDITTVDDISGEDMAIGSIDFSYDGENHLTKISSADSDFGTVDTFITWNDGNITLMESNLMDEVMSVSSRTYGQIPNDANIDLSSVITSSNPADQSYFMLLGIVGERNADLTESEDIDGTTYIYSYSFDDSGRVVKAEIRRDTLLEATYEIKYAE